MPDFLLELGCEEIPARMLDSARQELERRVADVIKSERLAAMAEVHGFSTPRRLAVLCHHLHAAQPDLEEQVLGPAVKVAFKDGQPTAAANAFAKKAGIEVGKLARVETPKGEYLAATITKKGRSAAEVIAERLPREIAAIHWIKTMHWRSGAPERFVRPVRWIVAMMGAEVVPLEFAGVKAGNISRGHRFRRGEVKIQSASGYKAALEAAHVIVDPEERTLRVRKVLDAAARTIPGALWREDAALLETVVNLTEWPSALLGSFDPEFLQLPEEVLVTVMRDHQKYFALEDTQGRLINHFLAVLNTESDAGGLDLVRHGHERVLRARFNDARFFWQQDQKLPLRERVESLKQVTFQKDLGSYYEKSERVRKLAESLAADIQKQGKKIDVAAVGEAARLAKTDLTTELVKEFTELQGIVGGLYARAQGHSAAVADAIYDHYKPESMEDRVPRSPEGAVLSIADKMDTIVGMFALGLQPTGSKDPFALRRQANGIVKTIAEHSLTISFNHLLDRTFELHRSNEKISKWIPNFDPLRSFWKERLHFYLHETLGYAYDVVNAVLGAGVGVVAAHQTTGYDDVTSAQERAEAVATVRNSADFEAIAVSFKRMRNILTQAREAKSSFAGQVDTALFNQNAEKTLYELAKQVSSKSEVFGKEGKFFEALSEISRLRPAIDAFFDKVMVMVDDSRLRANRLALLTMLLNDFSTIADFSEIVTESKAA